MLQTGALRIWHSKLIQAPKRSGTIYPRRDRGTVSGGRRFSRTCAPYWEKTGVELRLAETAAPVWFFPRPDLFLSHTSGLGAARRENRVKSRL